MVKLYYFLDCRYRSKDGTYPLKLAVSLNGSKKLVDMGIRLRSEEWNGDDMVVRPRHEHYCELNNFLREKLEKARSESVKVRLCPAGDELGSYVGAVDRVVRGERSAERRTFGAVLRRFAERKKPSTQNLYLATLRRMRDFDSRAEDLDFEDIGRDWLEGFNCFLSRSSNSQNYRNILLRNIRAVFNFAIDEGITTLYPFRRFKIRPVETVKRSLSVEQLRELFAYPVEDYARQYVDMFKLMFMLCGINGVDLFGLKCLEDGRAVYHRAKTGKLYSVKVEPEAMEIIERYRGKEWLLNVRDRYGNYQDYAHRMNHALQRIGLVERRGRGGKKIIESAFPGLTCYWARHTWATIAAEIDVPDAVISQALGHSPTNATTEIYIRRNPKKVDDANRRVIDFVMYGKR